MNTIIICFLALLFVIFIILLTIYVRNDIKLRKIDKEIMKKFKDNNQIDIKRFLRGEFTKQEEKMRQMIVNSSFKEFQEFADKRK